MAPQTRLDQLKGRFALIRSSIPFITCTVAAAVFTEAFLYAVVDPVFPFSLMSRNNVPQDKAQDWVGYLFTAEAVGVLIAAPVFGWLSDHIANRRRPLLFGIVILLIAHTILCFTKSLAAMVFSRVMQGISAGAVWCIGLALLAENCPPDSVGKMLGYATTAYSVGGFSAPFVGGLLYKHAGYYAVFGVGFALIVVDGTFRMLLMEPTRPKEVSINNRTISVSSHILPLPTTPESALSSDKEKRDSFAAFFADSDRVIPRRNRSSSTEETLCTASPSTLTEPPDNCKLSAPKPWIKLLKSRRMLVNFAVNTVISMIVSGLDVTLALFVKNIFGWDAQGAGLIYIAIALPTLLQMVYGRLVDRFGPRWPATVGICIGIGPFACFRFVEQNTLNHKILLSALILLIGFSVALTLAATMTEFTSIAVEKERQEPGSMGSGGALAQSYSLFNVSWAIGAIAGSNFAANIHKHFGWGMMGFGYAALSGTVLIPAVLLCGGWIGSKRECGVTEKREDADSSEHLV